MNISRVWAMPHRYTFKVRPLLDIVLRYRQPETVWVDPFAGFYSPAEVTNDLNPDAPTLYHLEASEFMVQFCDNTIDGAIFDPPYSLSQVSRSYKDIGLRFKGAENPTGGFPRVRDAIQRSLKPGGIVISFGWNTVGMGKTRGFTPLEYLMCSHGGNRNDTLVVVEQKIGGIE